MQDYLKIVEQINQAFEQFTAIVQREVAEAKQLEHFHLTPQQEFIMYYIVRNEPVTARQIALYLDVSMSAVSHVMPKLEEQKMIVRWTNPENKREALIRLGERGLEYSALLHRIDDLLVRDYYSKVSMDDLEAVHSTLQKLVKISKMQARKQEEL